MIIGSSVVLAACSPGSGLDKRQVYRDAVTKCAGSSDQIDCRYGEQERLIDVGYAAICRAKGIADNSPAMRSCKRELAYADCVRSNSDYQGYIGQMNSHVWQPSPSTLCRKYYPAV